MKKYFMNIYGAIPLLWLLAMISVLKVQNNSRGWEWARAAHAQGKCLWVREWSEVKRETWVYSSWCLVSLKGCHASFPHMDGATGHSGASIDVRGAEVWYPLYKYCINIGDGTGSISNGDWVCCVM